jgi:hypothetical protein
MAANQAIDVTNGELLIGGGSQTIDNGTNSLGAILRHCSHHPAQAESLDLNLARESPP